MARKKITIDLNGGDNVSADSALVFQFYDADSSDAIITTANYAAVGSEDVPGTDGTNITYDSTTTPGSMILDGVDIGSATNLKVSVKDEAGNESALSAAFTSFIILFEDDFAGTTIDAAKWDVTNPSTPDVVISQNEKILITSSGTGSAPILNDNNYISKVGADITSGVKVFAFDIDWQNQNLSVPALNIGLNKTKANRDDTFIFLRSTTAGNIKFNAVVGGVPETESNLVIDLTNPQRMKLVFNNGNLTVHHWNGASWDLIDTRANGYSGVFYIYSSQMNNAAGYSELNNAIITDVDYATQYPSGYTP